MLPNVARPASDRNRVHFRSAIEKRSEEMARLALADEADHTKLTSAVVALTRVLDELVDEETASEPTVVELRYAKAMLGIDDEGEESSS
jgi:hypothetical protein